MQSTPDLLKPFGCKSYGYQKMLTSEVTGNVVLILLRGEAETKQFQVPDTRLPIFRGGDICVIKNG